MKRILLLSTLLTAMTSLFGQEFTLELPHEMWPGDRIQIEIRFEQPTMVHMTGACDDLPVYSVENYSRSGWTTIHKQLPSDMGCDKTHQEKSSLTIEQTFQVSGRYRVCLDELGCSAPFNVRAIPKPGPIPHVE